MSSQSFDISFFQGRRAYEARVEPYNGISQTSFPGICGIAAYRVVIYPLDKNAEIHIFYFGENPGDPLFWFKLHDPDKQKRAEKIAEKLDNWGGGDNNEDDPVPDKPRRKRIKVKRPVEH